MMENNFYLFYTGEVMHTFVGLSVLKNCLLIICFSWPYQSEQPSLFGHVLLRTSEQLLPVRQRQHERGAVLPQLLRATCPASVSSFQLSEPVVERWHRILSSWVRQLLWAGPLLYFVSFSPTSSCIFSFCLNFITTYSIPIKYFPSSLWGWFKF